MAEFLTTNGTSYYIENIIIEAKKELYLVSPYLQLSKTFYERLKDATNRGVIVKIIYGKDELKPNERSSLAELKNIELYFFENLHAKCYFNETKMVITSMNMYAFSEKNNREMGVFIDKNNDKDLFDKAVNETFSILQSADVDQLKKADRSGGQTKKTEVASDSTNNKKFIRGYCIRCEGRIDFDPGRPYCMDCYSTWSIYKNPFFEENVCHKCGKYETTSMEKPQCYSCYNISEYEKDTALNVNSSKDLSLLCKELKGFFPSETINKGTDYIFFKGVIPYIDAFIDSLQITLKYTEKKATYATIVSIDTKIKVGFNSYDVVLKEPGNSSSYYYWDLSLKTKEPGEVKSIIETLKKIRF